MEVEKQVFKCVFDDRVYEIVYRSTDVFDVLMNGSLVCSFYSVENAFDFISNVFDDFVTSGFFEV